MIGYSQAFNELYGPKPIKGNTKMNERIRELAEQATEEVMRNTPSFLVTNEMWKAKFAELIVKECAKLVDDHDPTGIIEGIVLQHFGVEE